MRDAVQLQIIGPGAAIIEDQHRSLAVRKELLDGQQLPPVTDGITGQQPQLRHGIDHDHRRVQPLDLFQNAPHRVRQLHLGGIEDRVLTGAGRVRFFRNQLQHLHPGDVPAVRGGGAAQLFGRLRQRDVEGRHALDRASEKKLHGECRLASARLALQQIHAARRQAASKNIVQSRGARGYARYSRWLRRHFSHFLAQMKGLFDGMDSTCLLY